MRALAPQPLTPEGFAPWGEVLEARGAPDRLINQGFCARYHDRARPMATGGHVGISVFLAQPRALPYALEMVERHPLGSQAFLPMTENPFLVVVAPDAGGRPGDPVAFLTDGAQGIALAPGAWHGVLTPLAAPGLFAVVDRIAPAGEAFGANLEEHWFAEPWTVMAP